MLTIKDAAIAIDDGITRTQIKKWLERGHVDLPHLKTGSQGAAGAFPDYDLCYLALVNRIVDELMAPPKLAGELAKSVFSQAGVTDATTDLLAPFRKQAVKVTRPYAGQHAPIILLIDPFLMFSEVLERAAALRAQKGKAA